MKRPTLIVNEADEVIGVKEREDVLADDIYRVSALWITSPEGDVLLARRAWTKSYDPGKWGPAVAGTVEEGETYEANILKEAKEELGLTRFALVWGPKVRRRGKHNYFAQWYYTKLPKDAPLTPDPVEVAEVRWFTAEELRKEVEENPGEYLASIIEMVASSNK